METTELSGERVESVFGLEIVDVEPSQAENRDLKAKLLNLLFGHRFESIQSSADIHHDFRPKVAAIAHRPMRNGRTSLFGELSQGCRSSILDGVKVYRSSASEMRPNAS